MRCSPWRKNYFNQISKNTNGKYCAPVFKSHSPHEYVKKLGPKMKMKIFVGRQDKNTLPIFSVKYHQLLIKNKKSSEIFSFEGDHTSLLKNKKLRKTMEKIINP